MSLKDDKQQNIQKQLDFPDVLTGEAREVSRKESESSGAKSEPENPARTKDRKSTRLNSSHLKLSRMPSSA